MIGSWESYKLADLVEDVAMGPFGSNLKVDNFISSGVPVIRGSNLNKGGFQKNNFVFVSESKARSLKRSLAYPDDLVFTHRGTIGQVGIIPKNQYPFYLVSQSQMRLTVNKKYLIPKFLYYFFQSSLGQRELLKNASQVGVPAIANPTKSLKDVNVLVPPLEEQICIASILASLDDKIEHNLQMNKTLEAIAQAIFKEWFVDFRFPGFDGKMVDGLPKGWRKGHLVDILDLQYGKALKSEDRREGNYPVIGSSGVVGFHDAFYVKGPGIVIGRKGTIGKVIWIEKNFFPIDTSFFIKDLLGTSSLYYHYFLLKDQPFQKISSDSAVPGLNKNEALRNNVIVPNKETVNRYNEIVKPIFEKMNLTNIENITLTQLRDILLPKLMFGKIRV